MKSPGCAPAPDKDEQASHQEFSGHHGQKDIRPGDSRAPNHKERDALLAAVPVLDQVGCRCVPGQPLRQEFLHVRQVVKAPDRDSIDADEQVARLQRHAATDHGLRGKPIEFNAAQRFLPLDAVRRLLPLASVYQVQRTQVECTS